MRELVYILPISKDDMSDIRELIDTTALMQIFFLNNHSDNTKRLTSAISSLEVARGMVDTEYLLGEVEVFMSDSPVISKLFPKGSIPITESVYVAVKTLLNKINGPALSLQALNSVPIPEGIPTDSMTHTLEMFQKLETKRQNLIKKFEDAKSVSFDEYVADMKAIVEKRTGLGIPSIADRNGAPKKNGLMN